MPDEVGTRVPESARSSRPAPPPAPPDTAKARSRRKSQGDVHVGSMGGDVRRVPGSGTENGDKAIADFMRDVLERVRRSIRERSTGRRR